MVLPTEVPNITAVRFSTIAEHHKVHIVRAHLVKLMLLDRRL